MHSAIIVVEVVAQRTDWLEFTAAATSKLTHSKNVERLGENVWLTNFQTDPSALGWLTTLCEQRGIPYRILPLADAPRWLPVGSDPRPN